MKEKKTYSFSRLTTFTQCPLQYNYRYNDKVEVDDSNFFSELGSFGHLLLEAYDRGKIKKEDLELAYWRFLDKKVVTPPPFPIERAWKQQTGDFFSEFKGFSTPAIGIEREFVIEFDTFKLKGFIDRETDNAIIDYKISNPFPKKKLKEKRRQLYLYAAAYKEKWGKFPDYLYFYFFRKQKVETIKFVEKDFKEAVDWATEQVAIIEATKTYPARIDEGFCKNLCSYRSICTEFNKN